MRLTVTYNLRRQSREEGGEPGERVSLDAEYDSEETIAVLCEEIAALGHTVSRVEADERCADALARSRPELVFNMAEGQRGASREAHVPALCEMLGAACTGPGVLGAALCQDKVTAKIVLGAKGVRTPRWVDVPVGELPSRTALPPFPLFVKPAREGSSMGISPRSLVTTREELHRQVTIVHQAYRQPALIETFLPGREFTVGLVGNGDLEVLPVMEINHHAVPAGYPAVYSYQFKKEWDADRFYLCPAPVDDRLAQELGDVARKSFAALECRDVARVDLRLDAEGKVHVLEVNPLPGMAPAFSDLPRMADAAGIGYRGLIERILAAAVSRCGL